MAIRAARLRAGLSQRVLAGRAGTTQNAISRWERGVVEPGLDTVASIVAACGFQLRLSIADPDPADAAMHTVAEAMTPRERLELAAGWATLAARARVVG